MKYPNGTEINLDASEVEQVNADAVSSWEETPEGWLKIDIPVGHPGVLVYDKRKGDAFTAREYRSEKELFNEDSIRTLVAMPVTVSLHPAGGRVTQKNFRSVVAGVVKDARRVGDGLVATVLIQDGNSINLIKQDKSLRGASLGYQCDSKEKIAGQSPWGEYDTVQKGIKYNHLTICRNPRNSAARFNIDEKKTMANEINVDEIQAENTTLKDANAKLKKENGELSAQLLKANNKVVNLDSQRDEAYERGLKDGKDAHLLATKAKELNISTEGMEPKTIKLAVIKKSLPDINTDSYSDEQIDVALSIAMAQKPAKKFEQRPRNQNNGATVNNDGVENTHGDYQKRIFNGSDK
ncbi:DUF2213 domain-containing protein [Serratia marcescens]|uniref:DUF2213 domain-containing protein n=1 Tax=Serratia marcescens TaxID=615 RepID=UPI000D80BC23|nr:DUF2213 domain-containing protein [Serratia marcescens]PYA51157.1 hypothetical protein DMW45_03705 [Serratia marcescens]